MLFSNGANYQQTTVIQEFGGVIAYELERMITVYIAEI
jgi:hypothetical protein